MRILLNHSYTYCFLDPSAQINVISLFLCTSFYSKELVRKRKDRALADNLNQQSQGKSDCTSHCIM